jgi:hypothetical protein
MTQRSELLHIYRRTLLPSFGLYKEKLVDISSMVEADLLVLLTRVNSTNVQYEGLRIKGVGHLMNSKIKLVKQGVYQK